MTQATLLALAGRAGDLYGRRRVFVIGVLVLCTGSILCALAWNAPSLVAFRILQAVGACAMAPTAYSYAAELFGPRERGVALGVMGGVLGLAPVLALNVAGLLVGTLGWRSVFWFSPVIGVFVLAGAALVLVEIRPADADHDFDLPGAVLAAVGPVQRAGGPLPRRGVGLDLGAPGRLRRAGRRRAGAVRGPRGPRRRTR